MHAKCAIDPCTCEPVFYHPATREKISCEGKMTVKLGNSISIFNFDIYPTQPTQPTQPNVLKFKLRQNGATSFW